jgi:two-component system NarL family response regulator
MPYEIKPRVLLADDHVGILAALRRMLQPFCEVVGSVTDGVAVLETATGLKADVVVLDIAMPGVSGLDICRQITQTAPRIKVIILTANNDADIRREALRVGASGFVLKQLMVEELPVAIQKAFSEAIHPMGPERD